MAFEKLIPQIMQQPQLMLQAAIAAQQAANQRKQFAIQNSSNIGDALLKGWQMHQTGQQQGVENLRAEQMMGMKRDEFGFEKEKHGTEMDFKERQLTEIDIPKAQAEISAANKAGLLSDATVAKMDAMLEFEKRTAGAGATTAEAGAGVAEKKAQLDLKVQEANLRRTLVAAGIDEATQMIIIEETFRKTERADKTQELQVRQLDQADRGLDLQANRNELGREEMWSRASQASAQRNLEREKILFNSGALAAKNSKEALDFLVKRKQFHDTIVAKPVKSDGALSLGGETDDAAKIHAKAASNYITVELEKVKAAGTKLTNNKVLDILSREPKWDDIKPDPLLGKKIGVELDTTILDKDLGIVLPPKQ